MIESIVRKLSKFKYILVAVVLLISILGESSAIFATDAAGDGASSQPEETVFGGADISGNSEAVVVEPVSEPVAEPEAGTDEVTEASKGTAEDATEGEETSDAASEENTEVIDANISADVPAETDEAEAKEEAKAEPSEVAAEEGNTLLTDVVPTNAPYSTAVYNGMITDVVPTHTPVQQSVSGETVGYSSTPSDSELQLPVRAADVVSMVLPVIPEGMFDYTLDPLCLLKDYGVEKEKYDGSSLYFKGDGEILYTDTSAPAIAKNKSSVPILMYISIQVENPYGWNIDYKNINEVNGDVNPSVGFSIIPVTMNGDTPVYHKDKEISVDESGHAELLLYLPGDESNFDEIGGNLVEKADASWFSAGFAVRGACGENSDWTDIYERSAEGESITLRISYRMATLTESQTNAMESGLYSFDGETCVIGF
jgi:hypothetical protein